MKAMRLILPLLLAGLACSFLTPQEAAPLPALPPASVTPAASAPTAQPVSPAPAADSLLYISGTTHIESAPKSWPDPEAFLAFLQQVTDLGLRWSVGADVGWLEGEPRAAGIIQQSEALGVQWDVHTHAVQDRARAAALITQLGGHPTSVVSGMLVDEWDAMRQPLTYQGYTWTPQVLWGGTNCPGHRPGCDDLAAGLWIPLGSGQYQVHDPNGTLIRVGGGTHQLADGLALAQALADGRYDYPVISFTLMVMPSTLRIVESADGIEQIAAFVRQMQAYPFVRWATIAETAQAWQEAGRVPSRIEMP